MTNIALLVLDTLRKDAVSPYTANIEYTPHLESFAETAVTFENAVAQSPWSFPSQTSILTGQYPWTHGGSQRRPYLDNRDRLLQHQLADWGYKTGGIHQNTWLIPATGVMRGFDTVATPADGSRWLGPLWCRLDAVPGSNAVRKRIVRGLSTLQLRQTIDKKSDGQELLAETDQFLGTVEEDFFLYANVLTAHYPYNPPEPYRSAHDITTTCGDLKSRPLEYGGPVLESERATVEKMYRGEVAYLDAIFGALLDQLARHDHDEETVVIVCADHGEHLGENQLLGHHFSVGEPVTDVPLFVHVPDGDTGVITEMTELRDLYNWIEEWGRGGDLMTPWNTGRPSGRLVEDAACGLYGDPTIYADRLPGDHPAPRGPQAYIVTEDVRWTVQGVSSRALRGVQEKATGSGPFTDVDALIDALDNQHVSSDSTMNVEQEPRDTNTL